MGESSRDAVCVEKDTHGKTPDLASAFFLVERWPGKTEQRGRWRISSRANARWGYPQGALERSRNTGVLRFAQSDEMYGGTAILNSVERAGELIFESLEFGVFQFKANARWGYSNPEFALKCPQMA